MRYGAALAISTLLALPIPSQAQAVVWTGDAVQTALSPSPGDPVKGRAIVISRQTGLCILCHAGPFPEERFQGNLAPDLRLSIANLSVGQLRGRLVDPARSNPNTIMPAYFRIDHLQRVAPQFAGKTVLTGQEIEDVLAYLLTMKSP
jgi:sulfur-oxidizing protein SoxX